MAQFEGFTLSCVHSTEAVEGPSPAELVHGSALSADQTAFLQQQLEEQMWLAADAVAQHRAGRSGAADFSKEVSGADGGGQAAQRRADKGKAPAAVVDTAMQTGGANRKESLQA